MCDDNFPLRYVLLACNDLKRLHLSFVGFVHTKTYLGIISEHALQVTTLELIGIDSTGVFSNIWAKLQNLEELAITTKKYVRTGDMYAGIEQNDSRVQKLVLGDIYTKHHLSAAVVLCQASVINCKS